MGHAVVIGSSMAGLLAARVLGTRFGRVTVLERDERPPGFEPRKGVPQGRHLHVLLQAGENALAELFPGIVAEMERHGAVRFDFAERSRWFHHGAWKRPFPSGLIAHAQSRPLLEGIVRARVHEAPNIVFRYGTEAAGLVLDAPRARVTGVRVREAGALGEGTELRADLVVDASGRASRLPAWLAAAGLPAPAEERVGVDITYATRLYHRPARAPGAPFRDWDALLVYQDPPAGKRIGAIYPIEGDRWIVTLGGYLGEHPPDDEAGYLDFARRLERPDLYDAIRGAEPASDIVVYRFPSARFRHFERLPRFPAGVLPLGDAVCSFDPVFGQGMTVAAKEAKILADYLDTASPRAGAMPFLRAQADEATTPWRLATSEDLRYPRVTGPRWPGLGLLQRYTRAVFRLSASDTVVYAALLRVLHLVAGPGVLFRPEILSRVLRAAGRPDQDTY